MIGIGWIEIILILVILAVLVCGGIAVIVVLVMSTKRRSGVENRTGRCPTCGQPLGPPVEEAEKSHLTPPPKTP